MASYVICRLSFFKYKRSTENVMLGNLKYFCQKLNNAEFVKSVTTFVQNRGCQNFFTSLVCIYLYIMHIYVHVCVCVVCTRREAYYFMHFFTSPISAISFGTPFIWKRFDIASHFINAALFQCKNNQISKRYTGFETA